MPRVNPKSVLKGRPPAEYRFWCQSLSLDQTRQKAIVATIKDRKSPHFAVMNKHVDAMAWGLPVQSIQTADVTPGRALTGEVTVRQLLAALPLLLAGHPALAAGLTGQQAVDAEFTVEE